MLSFTGTNTIDATTTGTTHVVYTSNNIDYTHSSTDTSAPFNTNYRIRIPAPEPEKAETVDVQIIIIFWVVETKRPQEPLRLRAWLKHPPRCRSPPTLYYGHLIPNIKPTILAPPYDL